MTLDDGFQSRLNFTRLRAALLSGKHSLTHREWGELVVREGGESLGDSSWSQIFGIRQPISARTAVAIARVGGVSVGWLLAGEGDAPAGYLEPPARSVQVRAAAEPEVSSDRRAE